VSNRPPTAVDDGVDLALVASAAEAFTPAGDQGRESIASASRAVPLLWLGLFDFDEATVRPSGRLDVFAAVAPVKKAATRAALLAEALPDQPPILRETAKLLAYELEQAPGGRHLALFPEGVFHSLARGASRSYLEQLFDLCSLWQQVREGSDWAEAEGRLNRIFPDVSRLLAEQEPRVAGYYLVGSLVDKLGSLDPYLIREGQGERDLEPEALAVGEAGLLLGRFDGTWKLMSSGTREDLRGVWGADGLALLVGQRGTVRRLRKGRCSPMEVPTSYTLNGVWGLSPRFVCAVGERGTMLAYDGRRWQPWPLPTESALHAVAGTGPDNLCVAGHEAVLYRFDGRAWNRMELPDDGLVNGLCAQNGALLAVGGGRRGGVLYRLERGGWVHAPDSPRSGWLEGLWSGWGDELGVFANAGPVLVQSRGEWVAEPLPVEQIRVVASGAHVMALGSSGRYEVILRRTESGWKVEASLVGLRLTGVWVAGRPKPPQKKRPPGAQAGSETDA
jgi:hypothetical protein